MKLFTGTKWDYERLQYNITSKSSNDAPISSKDFFYNWDVSPYHFCLGSDRAPESNIEQLVTSSSSASRISANMNEESSKIFLKCA